MRQDQPLCMPEIRKLSNIAETMANKILKEIGLTSSQSIALFLLIQNEERGYPLMTQRDLEHLMAMSNPAVAGVISRLESKGFVKRTKQGNDKRYNYLQPTAEGKALQQQFYPYLLDNEDILFQGFTDEEREMIYKLIERMLNNALKQINILQQSEEKR